MNTATTTGQVTCFWLEPTDREKVQLRRYVAGDHDGWTCADGWHDAVADHSTRPRRGDPMTSSRNGPPAGWADADWPDTCDRCDYRFADDDYWQLFVHRLYRTADGRTMILRDAPPGAMWDATWMSRTGPDGRCLVVICPDGAQWMIDGRASNCTRPDDDTHRCWVRDGEPPAITVGKNGDTCSAGAGSIATPGYHGFLRDGAFT